MTIKKRMKKLNLIDDINELDKSKLKKKYPIVIGELKQCLLSRSN